MNKTSNTFKTKPGLLVIVLLLIVSLLWRVTASATHVSFSQDAARDVWLTKQRAVDREWIVAYGPKTSIGNFYLPPLYNQIHLFFGVLTNHHPLTMKWVITLIESFTPLLLYLILRRVVRSELAILGSLIYLFSVQPSIYGTTAWNPNLIPFLAMMTLYGSVKVLVDKVFGWIVMVCLAAAWAMQLHFQAVVLLPFVMGICVMTIWKVRNWQVVGLWLIGGFLSFLFIAPYFWAEINNEWQNTNSMMKFFSKEHVQYFDRVSKPAYLFSFFPKFMERVTFGTEILHSLIGMVVYFFGFGLLILKTIRKRSLTHFLVLFYLVSIMITLRLFKGDKLDYYLSLLFPMAAILLVLAVSFIKNLRLSVIPLLIIIFLIGYKQSFWLPTNDLHQLKMALQLVEEVAPESSIRLLFHDDDYINTVFYGLNEYTDLKIDQLSPVVVDICNPRKACRFDFSPRSQHSLEYSAIAEYKLMSEYEPLYYVTSPNMVFWIGKVNKPDIIFDYSQIWKRSEAGSDQLLKL